MNLMNYLAALTVLTSASLAQEPNTQTKPQKPADPGAVSRSQADRTSPTTSGSDSRTWTGTIVNATCSQASDLSFSSSAAGGTASTKSATASSDQAASGSASKGNNEKSVYDREREVMKHCPADSKAASFAVLTDDGSFYKLDDTGNNQVKSQSDGSDKSKKKIKNMRVTVTGTVQGDTLKVQSLTKTDKPFGGSA
jgi:hypothetical protein